MSVLQLKMLSSLEKCFLDEPPESKREKKEFIMFRNERLSFQIAYRFLGTPTMNIQRQAPIRLGGALAPYATLRLVANVPNQYPTYAVNPGGAFLRTEPGLYPDLIRPLIYPDAIYLPYGQTHALWVDIELPEDFAPGRYDLSLSVLSCEEDRESELLGTVSGHVTVVDADLPKQALIHTEWFYTDCIANYYRTRAFSEKHWRLIENFLRTATKNGINMILTPIFTPELDTYVGGERLTTQLLEIEKLEGGGFSFNFDQLHRWIDLCLDCGVEYFEIPHFFTQWGAKAAPKIIVKVGGRKKKYFGWHTDAMGEEYVSFLRQLIPALLAEFKKRGLDKKCFFHVSDEPGQNTLEQYRKCMNVLKPLLEGYPIIDALSDFEFYRLGIIDTPVPNTRRAQSFLDAELKNPWVYYCGGGKDGVSDRSISMPSARTRILGVQLYYYNIVGFLHWGYNFYNCTKSYTPLDPYGNPDGAFFTPSGDCFLVYPGEDGRAWESLRLNALREAMDDIRALRLYEERFGRDASLALITRDLQKPLSFVNYPSDPSYLLNLRETIAKAFL